MYVMIRLIALSVAICLYISQNEAAAQCCAAGNPVSTNCGPATGGKNVLNISYSYMYSFSDTYYRGTEPLDKTYMENYFDYSSLAFSYGISDKLRITADIGYFFDKAQRFINDVRSSDDDYTRFASGISDGTLGINYSTYSSENNLFEIQQTARVTIPIGEVRQEYDGIILPIDFQPSSGNYRYSVGVNFMKRFEDSDFALMSFNSIEFSQAIETEKTYHKYGNLYSASLMGVYRISALLQGLLQLRYEIRDRALNGPMNNGSSNGSQFTYLNSSGGVIAYLSPQIGVNLFSNWMLSFQYNYPIYKNIYGDEQLTNRHSVSVNISRVLDFGGLFSNDPPGLGEMPVENDALFTTALDVRGACGMCKSRIEAVASEGSNVRSAEWSSKNQKLTVFYADNKPDIDKLAIALAAAGHDAGKHIAPADVYKELPGCCQYRETAVH
jgi:hypothetical protein